MFPDRWKIARIAPIYKADATVERYQYRPISGLLVLSKLFEKTVYDQLYNNLELNAIFAAIKFQKAALSTSGVETGGPGGALAPPPLFCNAVSNENNMKNIEITNGLIFKKHVAFLTSRLPMNLCP